MRINQEMNLAGRFPNLDHCHRNENRRAPDINLSCCESLEQTGDEYWIGKLKQTKKKRNSLLFFPYFLYKIKKERKRACPFYAVEGNKQEKKEKKRSK